MGRLRTAWRQLWCLHYWKMTDSGRFRVFHKDEWLCVYCNRVVVADWNTPPLSYVE